ATARERGDPEAYQVALDLYTGDLLPENVYEEWVGPRREALRRGHLSLLSELAERHEGRGETAQAIAALQRLVAEEPADEAAHTGLMRLYAAAGQRHQALRQYRPLAEA